MPRLHQMLLVTLLALTLSSAAGWRGWSVGQAADPRGTAFALLADNRLIAVRTADGSVIAARRLAPPPPTAAAASRFARHLLALASDGRTLFALIPGWPAAPGVSGQPDRLAVVARSTTRITATFPLPGEGGTYRSLAVGPQSGRLYLFGNRPDPATPPATPSPATSIVAGATVEGVIVTRLDPTTGAVEATWLARTAEGRDWLVYQGAVAPDERTLYVSYHGVATTGIDRFDLVAGGLRRCPPPPQSGLGCIAGHGGFAFFGDGLLTATGDSVILATDHTGAVIGAIDTRLTGNHLMEFAVDPSADRLYAVGSCGYAGGFSAVSLPHLDPATGATRRQVATTSWPMDVLVAPLPA